MMEGLSDKIRSVGHWRVNFRPLEALAERLSFGQCESAVNDNRVELRGWDYPHVSRRQDDTHGYARAGEYVENWIDWEVHSEFWRMYRSSQFLHYRALWEDLDDNRYNGRPRPSAHVLSVGSAIYSITEIFEFLFRLVRAGVYPLGVKALISLENTAGRQLWINESTRMPFSEPKLTGASSIGIERTIHVRDATGSDHRISMSAIVEIFEHFGWDVAASTLQAQQTSFLNRTIWG